MKRTIDRQMMALMAIGVMALMTGCSGGKSNSEVVAGKTITSIKGHNITATMSNARGNFTEGANDFVLDFKDDGGSTVDVGAITLYFDMPAMGSMPYMKSDAVVTTTAKPGVFRGTVSLEMKGTWRGKMLYVGPEGQSEMIFAINAQ